MGTKREHGKIYRNTTKEGVLSEWCKTHKVKKDDLIKIVSFVLGYSYEFNPLHYPVKDMLNKGYNVRTIAETLKLSTQTLNLFIHADSELYDIFKKKKQQRRNSKKNKKPATDSAIVGKLKELGYEIKGSYLPSRVFKELPYNVLLSVGLSEKRIESAYEKFGIAGSSMKAQDALKDPATVLDIIISMFSGEDINEITEKYGITRSKYYTISRECPTLNHTRTALKYSMKVKGYYKVPDTKIRLRDIMCKLNPKVVPEYFSDVDDVIEIGDFFVGDQPDERDLAAMSGRPNLLTIDNKLQKEIDVYTLYSEGINMKYICDRYKVTQTEVMEIVEKHKDKRINEEKDLVNKYDSDYICTMYKRYMTVEMISSKIGATTKEISMILRKLGIHRRTLEVDAISRYDVVDKFRNGKSLRELTEEYSVKPFVIRNIIHYFMGYISDKSVDLKYTPELELSNWSEFRLGILESDLTDKEAATMLNLPQIVVFDKRAEIQADKGGFSCK